MSLQSANNIGALPRRTTDGATTWWRSWYYNSTILLKCRLEDNVATLLLMKNIYMYIISQHVKPRKLWQFLHFEVTCKLWFEAISVPCEEQLNKISLSYDNQHV